MYGIKILDDVKIKSYQRHYDQRKEWDGAPLEELAINEEIKKLETEYWREKMEIRIINVIPSNFIHDGRENKQWIIFFQASETN